MASELWRNLRLMCLLRLHYPGPSLFVSPTVSCIGTCLVTLSLILGDLTIRTLFIAPGVDPEKIYEAELFCHVGRTRYAPPMGTADR